MARWEYFTIPNYPESNPVRIQDMNEILPIELEKGLREGQRVGDKVFARKLVAMHKKGGSRLTDFLYSIDRLLVGSERTKAFFEANVPRDEVEFVPFRLKDKKGKPRPERYYIVNPLLRIACMDRKRTDANPYRDPVTKEERFAIVTLQIEEDKVPSDARLFRLAEDPERILIRADLLDAVRAAGLTPLVEKKLGDFL